MGTEARAQGPWAVGALGLAEGPDCLALAWPLVGRCCLGALGTRHSSQSRPSGWPAPTYLRGGEGGRAPRDNCLPQAAGPQGTYEMLEARPRGSGREKTQ